ncbi:acyl-CoA dehydrogenase family protein [Actibacterium sp. D379-3]
MNVMNMQPFHSTKGGSPVLDAVREFLPEIADEAENIEKNGGLSAELNEKLRAAGAFRMLMPKASGGMEMDLLQTMNVVEEIARADASAAWTAMVATGFNAILPLFPDATIKEILTPDGDVMIRGALAPKGVVTKVEGGYRVTGQWPLGSGSYPYKWVIAHAMLLDGKAPMMGENGIPVMKMVIVPAEEATFLDTWHSVGLQGSASHDYVLDDVFVPEIRTASLFGKATLKSDVNNLSFRVITGTQHTAVSTGAALGALADLNELAQTKRPSFRPTISLVEDPVFRHRYGELVTKLDTLRGVARWHAEEYMELARAGGPVGPADEFRHGSMVAYVSQGCVEIIDEVFRLAGASACYRSNSIQRRWRDARVAAQHAAASTDNYQGLAEAELGVTPE